MAEISAVPVPRNDPGFIGPTFAQLKLTGFMQDAEGQILLSSQLATADEVDFAVQHLIKEAEKAGRAAKKILEKAKEKRVKAKGV